MERVNGFLSEFAFFVQRSVCHFHNLLKMNASLKDKLFSSIYLITVFIVPPFCGAWADGITLLLGITWIRALVAPIVRMLCLAG